MKFIKNTIAVFKKDMRLELKTKEIMSSMLVFSLLVVIVFSFIFEPGSISQSNMAGGIYWMALVFSGLLGLNKSMQSDIDGANLEAMLLSPVSRNAIFYGKVLSIFVFLIAMQVIMVPLFAVFYEVNLIGNPLMAVVIIGTTYAFSLMGTLFSLIAARSSTREILLPLLLLPVLVPVILGAIQATNGMLFNDPMNEYVMWIRLIVIFGVIFTALVSVLFEAVVED